MGRLLSLESSSIGSRHAQLATNGSWRSERWLQTAVCGSNSAARASHSGGGSNTTCSLGRKEQRCGVPARSEWVVCYVPSTRFSGVISKTLIGVWTFAFNDGLPHIPTLIANLVTLTNAE